MEKHFLVIAMMVTILMSWTSKEVLTGTTRQSTLTFYPDPVTWVVANFICNQSGTRLLHIEDESKQMLALDEWNGYNTAGTSMAVDGFWLGLTDTGNEFVWTGTLQPPSWSNWDSSSHDNTTQHCVQANYSSGLWNIADCEQRAFFVCEHNTGLPCTFERILEAKLPYASSTGSFWTYVYNDMDEATCLEKCKSSSLVWGECWAATVPNWVSAAPQCLIHYGVDVNQIQDPVYREPDPDFNLFLKHCYSVIFRQPGTVPTLLPSTTHGGQTNPTETMIPTSELPESNTNWMTSLEVDTCNCSCHQWSQEEKQVFLDTLLTSLTVNTSNLSSIRRKYISAHDDRPTAQLLGYSGGAFLLLALGLIITCDVDIILNWTKGSRCSGQNNQTFRENNVE